METFVEALRADWKGYENLRRQILKTGNFFGNDDETSNRIAMRLYDDLYEYIKNKKRFTDIRFCWAIIPDMRCILNGLVNRPKRLWAEE